MYPLERQTLKDVLDRSVALFPDEPALAFVGERALTFADLGREAARIAGLLAEHGVERGDRVAILAENMPNWGAAYFAITGMGAVAVPILPDFHSGAIHHILRHSGAKAVFVSQRLLPKLEDGTFDKLSLHILLDDFSILAGAPKWDAFAAAVKAGWREFERMRPSKADKAERPDPGDPEVLEDVAGEPESRMESFRRALRVGIKEFEKMKDSAKAMTGRGEQPLAENDVAAVIYTSGTTGNSKGVVLTHGNIVSNALAAEGLAGLGPSDGMLSLLPLSHTYECTLGLVLPMMFGVSVHYLQKPPTPSILLPALQKIRPTFLLCVPLVIEKIYRNKILPALTGNAVMRGLHGLGPARRRLHRIAGQKLLETFGGRLRCLCIGGAPLAPEVEQFLHEARFPYTIGYGLTETSPLVSGVMPQRHKVRSCGEPVQGVEVRIDAPNPETGEGEILIKGPNVMREYYKAPNFTKETFTKDGWLRTGDLGLLDEDGYLFIKGRRKNMILGPSGENIYPEEIEAVISEFDYVIESLVFERDGRLVARVHLDYDRIDTDFRAAKRTESDLQERIGGYLEELRGKVNARTSSFIKLAKVHEQPEPFEKTPTLKIKRYLYVDPKNGG